MDATMADAVRTKTEAQPTRILGRWEPVFWKLGRKDNGAAPVLVETVRNRRNEFMTILWRVTE